MGEFLVLIVIVLLVVGGASLYRRRAIAQREAVRRAELETQLSTSKRAADEDVTKFGEELQRLDVDVAGHPLDEAMQQDYQRALDAYVVPLGEARLRAAVLATELRRAGIRTDLAYGGRGLKGAMKGADRSGAAFAIVIGERDLVAGVAQVKSMDTGEQTAIPLDDLSSHLIRQLKELHP